MDPSDTDRNDPGTGAPHGAGRAEHFDGPPGQDDRWLRSVVEHSSEIVTVVNPDGTLRYANPAWARALGYDPEQAVGMMNVLDHVHPEDLAHVLEEMEGALAEGGVVTNEAEYRFRRKDGSWLWVESVGTYLLDDPAVNGMMVVSRDVTERKEAEERYRTLVERVPAMTYIHRQVPGEFSGTTYVSPQVEAVLGYTQEEYTSNPEFWQTILHPDDRERVLATDERTGESGEPFDLEFRMIAKDGRVVWFRESGTLVRDEDGRDQIWHGVMVDITELKRTEEELREAENRYRTLVEQIPAVTYIDRVTDGPDEPLYTSPQLEQMLGYTPEEWLLGGLWSECLHPEDRERVLAADERFEREREERFDEEYRLIAKDGSVVWVREEAVLVKDAEDEPLYWQGIIFDVTERKSAEEQLRLRDRAISASSDGIIITDSESPDDPIVYANAAFERITGYEAEEVLGRNCRFLQGSDRDQAVIQALRVAMREGQEFRGVLRNHRKDGTLFYNELHVAPVRDGAGRLVNFIGVQTDVTIRIRAEQALREAEQRYRTVVEAQTELVCRFLPDLTLTFVNDAYCRYFGKEREELIGSGFLDHVHAGDRGYYEEQLVRLNPQSPTSTVEERVLTPVGMRWMQWSDTAIFDNEGGVVEYQSVGRDVTERREAEERLEHQVFHDFLTGLPNRQLFLDRLAHALTRTERRRGKRVAVLFMDLDDFKVVNDSLGHGMGDKLLVAVSERLKGCLRPEDTLARFGGDEFTVLLEDIEDPDEPMRVAERITDELKDPLVLDGRELYARASIGIAMGEAQTKNPEELLRDADTAMYRAKDEGSGYSVFGPAMHEGALDRLEAENDLRRAVEREEFVVHYQPIVGLQTGEVYAVEALVRWGHPERGLLNPDEFVPMAEGSGMVVQMGEQVLKEACLKAREWQDKYPRTPPLVMSVNLSAKQLSRSDLVETVERVLREAGLEGNRLVLDVTETVYVRALEANTADLDRLRWMGVGISIDDFGTGYSSLSYLKRLPADALKIDRSFVAGLGEDVEDTAIVRMIVELAHTLGMEVVAEGVETEEQAAFLEEIGCDFAQGFYFAKPLPPEAMSEFLAN